MSKTNTDQYLFVFTEKELIETYEGLVLREELIRRFSIVNNDIKEEKSELLKKIGKQFSGDYAKNIQNSAIDKLDDYFEFETEDESIFRSIDDDLDSKE